MHADARLVRRNPNHRPLIDIPQFRRRLTSKRAARRSSSCRRRVASSCSCPPADSAATQSKASSDISLAMRVRAGAISTRMRREDATSYLASKKRAPADANAMSPKQRRTHGFNGIEDAAARVEHKREGGDGCGRLARSPLSGLRADAPHLHRRADRVRPRQVLQRAGALAELPGALDQQHRAGLGTGLHVLRGGG